MTTRDITKLTKKYSSQEIITAVKVLVDILAMHDKEDVGAIDPKDEFTPKQIKRLQKQLQEHKASKSKQLSLKEVTHALGL